MTQVDEARVSPARRVVEVPQGLSEVEASLLLQILSRVKAVRFGRIALAVSDGRVVDVEVTEKVDRDLLKKL